MKHSVIHVEIPVTHMARAKKFYGKLFKWKFVSLDKDYVIFRPGKGVGGALSKVKKISRGDSVLPYFEVDSIEKTLVEVKRLKAKVVVPPTSIGEHGRMAHFRDCEGNLIGLHQM